MDADTQAELMEKIWERLMRLAEALGAVPMNRHANCWSHRFAGEDGGRRWSIAVNGHDDWREWEGVDVPPFGVYVGCNGFPAGMIDTRGATIAAGAAINVDTFLAGLTQEVHRVEAECGV